MWERGRTLLIFNLTLHITRLMNLTTNLWRRETDKRDY